MIDLVLRPDTGTGHRAAHPARRLRCTDRHNVTGVVFGEQRVGASGLAVAGMADDPAGPTT